MEDVLRICSRCVLDSNIPGISFDSDGICNYCKLHDGLDRRFPVGGIGEQKLNQLLKEIKLTGRGKKYDCIVGFSGGCDSTYTLYMAAKLGLRVLAVNFDDGWGSKIAEDNIKKAVGRLNVGFRQIKADPETMNDWYKACLKASVPEPDLPCDIGYMSALWQVAAEERIKYIVVGNNFRTEGLLPLSWHYVDGRYFDSIIKKFAQMKSSKGFNRCNLGHIFYYMFVKGIKIVQLLVLIGNYNRSVAGKFLEKELGWMDTGAKHFDNLYQALVSYITRKKFKHDWRKIRFSAQVRSGEMAREYALEELKKEPFIEDKKHIDFCLDKLGMTSEGLGKIMAIEPKYFWDYPTYYSIIKTFKFPIKLFCKLHILQETLYEKYFKII